MAAAGTAPQAARGGAPEADGELPNRVLPARGRGRTPEASVYVDGAPIAVLRHAELPPGVKTHRFTHRFGEFHRYLLAEYLQAIKVDVARVQAVHLYGGARIVVIDGAELRKHASDLGFEFTLGDRGKVNMAFPAGIRVNTTIDLVTNIAVYQDRVPPTLHDTGSDSYLAFADGKPIDGMPYAARDEVKGTRVYVDGVLVNTLKRRTLPESIVVDGTAKVMTFSVEGLLRSSGIEARTVKAIDMLSGDDLVVRLDGPTWARERASMTFTLPSRSRGLLAIDIPKAEGQKARISAVQVFLKSEPPKRWLAPPEVVAMGGERTAPTDPALPPGGAL